MNFVTRLGVFAQKIGMSRLYWNEKTLAITLIKIPKNYVLAKKENVDSFSLKLGVADYKGPIKKPQLKEIEKINAANDLHLPFCSKMKEFKVAKDEVRSVGDFIKSEWLSLGSFVDITSKSIGKGFAGGMKRWGFSGGPASHGSSKFHRGIGSTGTRDFNDKGKKMPGRLGNDLTTIQNQKIVYIDDSFEDYSVVGVHGSIPGKALTWVLIRKAIKIEGVRGN